MPKKKTPSKSTSTSTPSLSSSSSSSSPSPNKRRRSLRTKTPTKQYSPSSFTTTIDDNNKKNIVSLTPAKKPTKTPTKTPTNTPANKTKEHELVEENFKQSNSKPSKALLSLSKKSKKEIVPVVELPGHTIVEPTAVVEPIVEKPQLKVHVHRFRNAKYIPNGILKLCATPPPPSLLSSSSSSSSSDDNHNYVAPHLAISREGGSVELISIDENWKCVGIVEGMKKRNIDSMAWICGRPSINNSTSITNTTSTTSSDNHNNNQGHYFCHNHKISEQIQSQRRLFGSSRDGTIFEIDFQSKTHIGVIGSGGGAVFCLESLCPRCSSSSTCASCCNLLAAGCEDGSVRIFKAMDRTQCNDSSGADGSRSRSTHMNVPCLELISTLPSVGCAITSIAWLPPPPSSSSSNTGLQGSVLYAGVADGTIRKFTLTSIMQNVRATGSVPHAMSTGMMLTNSSSHDNSTINTTASLSSLNGLQWKSTARLTVENRGERIPTKIWSLKALDDGTLISGDSIGNIQFWDGNTGTLLQSIEHNTQGADVLDIAVTLDQTKVMASGIDSKVMFIELDKESKTSNKWVSTYAQRVHSNDVNSLAMVYLTDPNGCAGGKSVKSTKIPSKYRELMCSGGVDTRVCSYFVSKMRKYRPKVAYKYPSNAPISLARQPRILSIMRSDKVDFFQLGDKRPELTNKSVGVALDEEKAYLGSVRISSNYNLMSFAINDDGTLLAVSHAAGLHLFALELEDSYDNGSIRKIVKPTKIVVPMTVNASCSSLQFSRRDPHTLVAANCNGTIKIISIKRDSEDFSYSVSLDYSFSENYTQSNFSSHYPITHLDISPDGCWLATGRNSLGKGSVEVYQLKPSCRHWWTIPCTEAPFSCMKWLGNGSVDPALVVALNNGAFYLFDMEERRLSDWSQDLGFPAGPNFPKEICHYLDRPDRVAFDPAIPTKFLLGGQTWFSCIDLDAPVPKRTISFPKNHLKAKNWAKIEMQAQGRKRSNSAVSIDDNSTSSTKKQQQQQLTIREKNTEPENKNFATYLRFTGMIFLDFLNETELVVVEQPWLEIVKTLPDPLERDRYGS